jgi:hypothetical protein
MACLEKVNSFLLSGRVSVIANRGLQQKCYLGNATSIAISEEFFPLPPAGGVEAT